MEIAQIIDKAINEYYTEKGQPVPQWKLKRDPDWWIEYLRKLEEGEWIQNQSKISIQSPCLKDTKNREPRTNVR